MRFGCNDSNRLAEVEQIVIREERLVKDHDAKQIVARYIRCGVAPNDARYREGRTHVDAFQFTGGDRAADEANHELASDRPNIIDVRRLTSYVAKSGIVRNWFTNAGHFKLEL